MSLGLEARILRSNDLWLIFGEANFWKTKNNLKIEKKTDYGEVRISKHGQNQNCAEKRHTDKRDQKIGPWSPDNQEPKRQTSLFLEISKHYQTRDQLPNLQQHLYGAGYKIQSPKEANPIGEDSQL